MPKRGVVRFLAVLAAGFALGVVGIAAWYIFGQSEPRPWNMPAAIDGATVRLTYTGSACRDSADVDVDENATRVVITVRETVRATSCIDVGVPYDVEVRLDAPLADRELVDGACQMSEYANYAGCRSSKSTVQPGQS
ncbi:MAG: hypothetical protein HHJ13_03215 [Phycicoccus sp.]|nr:hypothetical protein [Phycicoccus sp.]